MIDGIKFKRANGEHSSEQVLHLMNFLNTTIVFIALNALAAVLAKVFNSSIMSFHGSTRNLMYTVWSLTYCRVRRVECLTNCCCPKPSFSRCLGLPNNSSPQGTIAYLMFSLWLRSSCWSTKTNVKRFVKGQARVPSRSLFIKAM